MYDVVLIFVIECARLWSGFFIEDWPVHLFRPSAPNLDVCGPILKALKMFCNNINSIGSETRLFFIYTVVSLDVRDSQSVKNISNTAQQ